jgi:hypothetical protein
VGSASVQDLVAVNHFFASLHMPTLKREALMFNRIAVSPLSYLLSIIRTWKGTLTAAEYEWLCEQGILFEAKHKKGADIANKEYQEVDALARRHAKTIGQLFKEHGLEQFVESNQNETPDFIEKLKNHFEGNNDSLIKLVESEEFKSSMVLAFDYYTRGLSIQLRILEGLDTYPVLLGSIPPANQPNTSSVNDVIEITLKALPVPDEDTPWESIINFRNDSMAQKKFLALRNWINEVARMKLEPKEVAIKLEALISDYRHYMEIHRIKTRLDTLRTIVVADIGFITSGWLAGLGAVPGIIGMVVTPLYSIRQGRIALLEKELEAPGREIAYIVKAREEFSA